MIKLIAIVDAHWGISKNEQIPWSFSEDRRFFHKKTINSVVVMGKNTFFALGSPLKGRENCIISRTMESVLGVCIFRSFGEIISKCNDFWIIGGAELYNYALKNNMVHYALITQVNEDYKAD
ncbi:MAG: dihydrofolate reductase, partial [Holosporaceae bacterium]|nr:dihydrofolate reductase [Holosporaceae bacterium]